MALRKPTTGKVILATALIAALAAPFAAAAKGEGRHGPRVSFEQLDADGNGEVTQAELAAQAQARFGAADTDGDGFLSKEEISAKASESASKRASKRMEKMFERRDANSDGKLSIEEMSPDAERIAKRFERADTDESGGISKEEFAASMKDRRGGHRRGDKTGDKTE